MTRIEEQEIERSLQYAGEAGLGIDTPLAKLLFTLSALRKRTDKKREEVREAVEKYPDRLRHNLNLLLDDAHRIASKIYPHGPLFILDNLDRYTHRTINEAMLRQAGLFNGVRAHTIFVVPISLLYEPDGEAVSNYYDIEVLPMVPIFRRATPFQADRQVLEYFARAISPRVDLALFADPGLPGEVARLSGGCPRDLMHLLKQALLESDERIGDRAVKRSAGFARNEIARMLNREHYDVLASVHLDRAINSDEAGRFLLYHRAALEYLDENCDKWVGVHPLLWEAPEFQSALEAEKRRRGGLYQSS